MVAQAIDSRTFAERVLNPFQFYGRKTMGNDVFEGKWQQIRGQARVWWGKLTDDDLEQVRGKFNKLSGLLQEKYGYTRREAEDEIKKRTK